MENKYSLIRKTSLVIFSLCLLVVSTTTVAQNNNADVPPVRGTKKGIKQGLPGVDKGQKHKEDEIGAYTTRRRKLPPGQAKKIYGGSAKDYAPGQTKKRNNKTVNTGIKKSNKATGKKVKEK